MPKLKTDKEQLLDSYKAILAESAGFIAINPDRIDNVTITDFKKKLAEQNAKYVVVKNTLFKLALQDKNQPLKASEFDGQTAIIAYKEDPTVVAKLLKEVQTKNEDLLGYKFSVVDNAYFDEKSTSGLAEIPSKPELLAKLLGSLNAPLTGFMNAVTGNVRGFVRVLGELSSKGN